MNLLNSTPVITDQTYIRSYKLFVDFFLKKKSTFFDIFTKVNNLNYKK